MSFIFQVTNLALMMFSWALVLSAELKKSQIRGSCSQLHFLSGRDTGRGIGSLHLPHTCMYPSFSLCKALGYSYFPKFVPSCFIFLIPHLVSQSIQRLKCKHLLCSAATSIVKSRASLNTQPFLPQFVPLSWLFQIPDTDTTSWDSNGKKEHGSSSLCCSSLLPEVFNNRAFTREKLLFNRAVHPVWRASKPK